MAQGLDAGKLHAFLSNLQREFNAFRQFQAILSAEHTALIDGDAEALISLAQKKNECVIELTQIAEERNRYLTETTGSTNQIGMEIWLDMCDSKVKYRAGKLWQDLMDLARAAKELNQSNGQLIHTRLANNQDALHVLLGVNAGMSNLYGADGQAYTAKPTGVGRPLGKA